MSRGTLLVSASIDGHIKVWNVAAGTEVRDFADHRVPIRAMAVVPHRRQVISGDAAGIIRIWNLDDDKQTAIVVAPKRSVTSLSISGDGSLFAVGSSDSRVRMFDFQSLEFLWEVGRKLWSASLGGPRALNGLKRK